MPLKTLFYSALLGFLSLISPAFAHHPPENELPELIHKPPTPTKLEHPPKLPVKPTKKPVKPTKVKHPPKLPVNPKKVKVTRAEFGVFRRDKHGKITFIPTIKVPLEAGIVYGWRLQLKNSPRHVTWREVFRLPQLPLTWGTQNGENFSLSKNGTAAVTNRTTKVKKSTIKNSWTVTPGDPPGNHLIEVYIGNHHVASFDFEVVKPKTKKKKSE
ncbi:MAG: hypothetical protein HRU34_12655 [Richelia sp.]|nr:hypothetical protein [Richelia sp.]